MRALFVLLLLFSFWGCEGRNDLKNDLMALKTQSVYLPLDSMECICESHNDTFPIIRQLKFVVFTDSMECSACRLKRMYMWDSLMEENVKRNIPIKFYFIFSPSKKDLGALYFTMSTIPLSGSIYVDTTNAFLMANPHIPQNPIMRTFLLDEDNNVLLVGNPLENKKIEKLFWQIVEEKLGRRE